MFVSSRPTNTSIVSCPFHGVSCPFHGFLPAGLLLRILVASVLSSVVLVVRTVLFSTQSVYLWGILILNSLVRLLVMRTSSFSFFCRVRVLLVMRIFSSFFFVEYFNGFKPFSVACTVMEQTFVFVSSRPTIYTSKISCPSFHGGRCSTRKLLRTLVASVYSRVYVVPEVRTVVLSTSKLRIFLWGYFNNIFVG